MFKFIFYRLLQTIPVLLVLSVITFVLCRVAPGNAFLDEKAVPPNVMKKIEEANGLDKPLPVQYFVTMGSLLTGDLPAIKNLGRTVNELIAETFPYSFELGFISLVIALMLGIPLGVFAAVRRNTLSDYISMSVAMAGICLPTFVLGPLLVLIFAVGLGWFNPLGWEQPSDRVLPCLTLGTFYAAYIARLARGGMLEVLNQDFVRTAQAKGVPPVTLIIRHTLKGGLLPVVSYLGPAFARIISGSFVIETIFFIPGLGRFFVTSAFNRDYNMIMGTVLFYAALLVLLNLVVDIIQVLLNPRLKFH